MGATLDAATRREGKETLSKTGKVEQTIISNKEREIKK